jgi:HAD superfamily hydrolase (TIGR01509 family)
MSQTSDRSFTSFIFDIDGTLVDSNDLHVQSWDRAFRHFGKSIPIEALREQIGKGSDQYLPEFLTANEIERFGKELDDYRSEVFRTDFLPKVKPFPKVRELFERIKKDGKTIVLASSGKQKDTEHYVKLLKIDKFIDGCTSGDEARHSKPKPDIFTACIDKFGFARRETIVIGDTRFDVEAAARAGLRTIGVSCGGTDANILRAAGAIEVYNDPEDLLVNYDTIKSISKSELPA